MPTKKPSRRSASKKPARASKPARAKSSSTTTKRKTKVQHTASQKAASTSNRPGPRLVVSNADVDKQRLAREADVAIHTEDKDELIERVASYIRQNGLTDFHVLRSRAIVAMGEHADKALGSPAALRQIDERKAGAGHQHDVHPLDLVVLEGTQRINPRDFSAPDMIDRVAELTVSVSARGVRKALEFFVQKLGDNDEPHMILKGGETRLRSTFTAWIMTQEGILSGAPTTVPAVKEKHRTNDVDRILDIDSDSDARQLKPIERAQLYWRANALGASEEVIAQKIGKSVATVRNMLDMMAMPEAVLNLVREGKITINYANKKWTETGHDSAETIKLIQKDLEIAVYTHGDKVTANRVSRVSNSRGGSSGSRGGSRGSSRSSSSSSASEAQRPAADQGLADKLKGALDSISGVLSNVPWKVEDGFVVPVGLTIEAFMSISNRIGVKTVEGMEDGEAAAA